MHSEVVGDTVTWSMLCSGKGGEVKGTGKIIYSGNSFKGAMKMTMKGQENMEMTSHMSGKRLGDCK